MNVGVISFSFRWIVSDNNSEITRLILRSMNYTPKYIHKNVCFSGGRDRKTSTQKRFTFTLKRTNCCASKQTRWSWGWGNQSTNRVIKEYKTQSTQRSVLNYSDGFNEKNIFKVFCCVILMCILFHR